ncbi:hypothetical protein [Allomuricauda sp. d1]|uniref:hypothetical protein n=1 Tax=Allomuricauda sp. d1 TaxID=3136725 RepID=UPI0031DCE2CA
MKSICFFLLVFLVSSMGVQAQFNEYKYIIVPKRFDAFKKENQYQTSTLIKHLFVKKGFNAVYEGDYPEDLKKDPCLALKVRLKDDSSLFRTKTTLFLQNCELQTVFTTIEGGSKLKEYKKSYDEAIRRAFSSFDIVNYSYEPKEEEEETSEETVTLNFKNDVKSLDETPKNVAVEQKATPEDQSFKSMEPVESNIKKASSETTTKAKIDLLYAQPIENGYQLVDSTPKIKYRILNTSADGVYLVEGDELSNGLMFKKEGKWLLEGTKTDGTQIKKEIRIKF